MDSLLQILLGGVTIGCVYALVALGFTLTIAAAGIVNFAYSEWVTWGAYLGVTFAGPLGLPLWLALVLAVAGTAAIGYAFQRLVFAPLEGRHFLTTVVATVGVGIAMQSGAILLWGPYALSLRPFFGSQAVSLGGVAVLPHSLLVIALTVALILGLNRLLTRTAVGLRLQAAAQDPEAARLMGIPLRRMRTLAYCVSAALAGLAGFLVAPLFVVTAGLGFAAMLKGFAATILGGWGNLQGAVLGGVLIGLIEALTAGYLSTAYKDAISFTIIILVLVVRPQGLFGERIAVKL